MENTDDMDLYSYLQSAGQSLFRFESLQEYNVEGEKKEFEEYLRTGKIDLESDSFKEWCAFIEKNKEQGAEMRRVRLVTFPLTHYTQYELYFHQKAVEHGDDIKIIDEKNFKKIGIRVGDYWLIDKRIALLMNYGNNGEYLGFEVIDKDVERFLNYKKLLSENSVSLHEFLDSL